MKLLVVLLLLGVVASVAADTCYRRNTRRERHTRGCGWLGWKRCAYYRTSYYTTSEYCRHGGWSPFSRDSSGPCSKSCGGGTRTVVWKRTCTNPTPYGQLGRSCTGSSTQYLPENCNTQHCPVDGGWTGFSAWRDLEECSVLCGTGHKLQERNRSCTNPAPAYGGSNCTGAKQEIRNVTDCNDEACGDRCPSGHDTYIANANNVNRYYRCDNEVARLMKCKKNTRWDQDALACVHSVNQETLHTGNDCVNGQYYEHASDCSKYNQCDNGHLVEHTCPANLRFDIRISNCNHAALVPCAHG